MLNGSLVAIATPMQADGALDLPALRKLIDFHIANGTSGIVIVGTTGESPTVDFEEHCLLIKTTVEHVDGRIPVIAGTGANSTSEAIELTRYAQKVGANFGLSVVPYYNKPSQEGLYRHFRAIAEKVGLPLLVYNVPGRTVADLGNETLLRLAQIPGVVGVKDATSDLVRHVDLLRRLPKDKPFALLSGNDDTALAYILLGGHGVISVTANVAPRAMADMCAAAIAGRIAEAREINCTAVAAAYEIVCRSQPDSGQMGARRDGSHRPRVAAAADRARCAASRRGAFGAARSGLPLGEYAWHHCPLFKCMALFAATAAARRLRDDDHVARQEDRLQVVRAAPPLLRSRRTCRRRPTMTATRSRPHPARRPPAPRPSRAKCSLSTPTRAWCAPAASATWSSRPARTRHGRRSAISGPRTALWSPASSRRSASWKPIGPRTAPRCRRISSSGSSASM